MGTKRLDTVSDCIKHDLDIIAKCPCGRAEVFDAQELYTRLLKEQKSTNLIEAATHFKCKRCERKRCRLQPVPRF